MANKSKYDWEAIEKEFKANQLSIREISRRYKCPESSIRNKMKTKGIKRSLAKKVRAEIQEKLLREPLRTSMRAHETEVVETKTFDEIEQDERQSVDNAAERGADVLRIHRSDINKSLGIVSVLRDQLISAAENREELESEIIEHTNDDGSGKIAHKKRVSMLKAVSLPAHAGVLRDLSVAQKNLITLERQAWNLNDTFDPDDEEITEIPIVAVPAPERSEHE